MRAAIRTMLDLQTAGPVSETYVTLLSGFLYCSKDVPTCCLGTGNALPIPIPIRSIPLLGIYRSRSARFYNTSAQVQQPGSATMLIEHATCIITYEVMLY